jgi:hypothetical protein
MKRSWSWREWLPNAATLTLIDVTTTAAGVQVKANGPSFGRCPPIEDFLLRLLLRRRENRDPIAANRAHPDLLPL